MVRGPPASPRPGMPAPPPPRPGMPPPPGSSVLVFGPPRPGMPPPPNPPNQQQQTHWGRWTKAWRLALAEKSVTSPKWEARVFSETAASYGGPHGEKK
ncbi:hypothetical protein DEO72_LG7g1735 [Vigna unguiculata]|uniref:Uncharacterized protein n=1 Tax=Vigna unguiculata TaxID=3917 RepID=A0A4D6ML03_VIGUN|nr:hypothetical protein DEO72_LG7g1735 [Vigna unguiculata]